MYQCHIFFSGESDDDSKDCPRELWFGQGSGIKSHKYINITIFYLVKVTMTVKTAPENSGLVRVQVSNLKKTHQYHNFFQVKVTMTLKTAPENSGLAKVQWSNLKNVSISHFFLVKVRMPVKTAPENSGLVRVQVSNLKNIYQYHNSLSGESDDDCKDCPRELWFGQGSVIKSQKYINIKRIFLLKETMTVKTAPENSGLVKVQLSNLTNISISQYSIWWKWRWL